jgi:hypothetical protein
VAASCECAGEPSSSGAAELVNWSLPSKLTPRFCKMVKNVICVF